MQNLRWKILNSSYVIKDRWLSLRSDTCQMPSGRIVAPYYVMEYPTWVNVVAVTEDHQIVLVRQYRHGLRRVTLEIPSGCVETTDASPLAAMRRELLEETGYTSDIFIETTQLSANPANHNNMTHCFLAIGVKHVAEARLDENEQIDLVLVPLKEFIELLRVGELCQALHVGSALFALMQMGIISIKAT